MSAGPVRIRPFKPASIKPDSVMLFMGPRRTGKTTSMVDILSHLKDKLYAAQLHTPTQDTRDALSNCMPFSLFFDDFNIIAIRNLVDTMRTFTNGEKAKAKREDRDPENRYVMLLLDDCMADRKRLKSTEIRDIMYNGRHENIMLVMVVQYMMDIDSNLRGMIDYVFATRDETPDNIERLWKYFFKTAFPVYDVFQRVYRKVTQNFGVLVYDRTITNATTPMDKVFFFRARPNVGPYRFGHRDMWTLHYRHLRSRHTEIRKGDDRIKQEVTRSYHAVDKSKSVAEDDDGNIVVDFRD